MAEVAGKSGSITFTDLVAGVKGWTLSGDMDMLPTTDYGDSGHKTFIGGLDGWTATVDLNWDVTNILELGDSSTLYLYIGAGSVAPLYYGTALVSHIGTVSVVEGIVSATVNFQGTGAYSYTAA